jgi:hypothetical protein
VRFLGEATDLAESDHVRNKADDQQPRIALHRQYKANTKNNSDHNVGDDSPKQIHIEEVIENPTQCKFGVTRANKGG